MSPALNPRILGQAELTHSRDLDELLQGHEISNEQWFALVVTRTAGTVDISDLLLQFEKTLRIGPTESAAFLDELTSLKSRRSASGLMAPSQIQVPRSASAQPALHCTTSSDRGSTLS